MKSGMNPVKVRKAVHIGEAKAIAEHLLNRRQVLICISYNLNVCF